MELDAEVADFHQSCVAPAFQDSPESNVINAVSKKHNMRSESVNKFASKLEDFHDRVTSYRNRPSAESGQSFRPSGELVCNLLPYLPLPRRKTGAGGWRGNSLLSSCSVSTTLSPMRRATLQALRSARHPLRASRIRNALIHHNHASPPRPLFTRREKLAQLQLLPSSMYFRNFSVALVSTLVASGAYFAYRGGVGRGPNGELVASSSPLSGPANTRSLTSGAAFSAQPTVSDSFQAPSAEAQSTRKALVVDGGELFTGTITGNEPLDKSTDDYGRKVLEMMSPEQATQRLRRNQQSFLVGRGKGVVRYDVVQLASNDPIEDDHAEKIVEVAQDVSPAAQASSPNDWMFWGVFDGHSGWTTSARLREKLISYVARELNTTYKGATNQADAQLPSMPTPSAIDAAIKRGFIALDTNICQDSVNQVLKSQSKPQAASLLAPALSGSCALLSFYDSASKTLRVACTGDSRAVLGRRSNTNTGKWTAHPLSVDQTGATEEEAARLRREHPGEPDVVRNGRVLGGLEPTRAFGDATYKWSREIQDKMKKEFFGRTSNPMIRTPPYVTAEPVVTSTKVQPEKGDFLVMATDGLWEMLTNDEVVGLVGQWLEKHPEALQGAVQTASGGPQADSWLKSWWSDKSKDLPVQQEGLATDQSGQRAPIRQQQWGLASSTTPDKATPSSSRFVVEDKNVATHLVRNALGGKDRDMVCALLTLPSPYSRRYRDDLTVEVIFFGEGGEAPAGAGGDRVMVNEDATAKVTDDLKSKL